MARQIPSSGYELRRRAVDAGLERPDRVVQAPEVFLGGHTWICRVGTQV